MKTLDTFRINRVERNFLEQWASSNCSPGDQTPDGGLVILEDGALAMRSAIDEVRIADIVEGVIFHFSNPQTQNPVAAAYGRAVEEIREVLSNPVQLSQRMEEASSQVASDSLRDLARTNRPVLKHLIALHKMYRSEDPHLQSKDAKTAMQAVLSAWDDQDIEAAYMFGRAQWEPDPITWMSFFDEVGSQPLGTALGMGSTGDIPEVPGSEFETAPEDIPEEEPYNHDDDEAESDAFDAGSFLQ